MKYSEIAKKMTIAILTISAIGIVLALLYYRSWAFLPFMFGTILGGVTSVVKVFLLQHAVDVALTMEKTQVGKYVVVQHLLRLGISAIALLLGALVPQINLWGVVVGILAYHISLYVLKGLAK